MFDVEYYWKGKTEFYWEEWFQWACDCDAFTDVIVIQMCEILSESDVIESGGEGVGRFIIIMRFGLQFMTLKFTNVSRFTAEWKHSCFGINWWNKQQTKSDCAFGSADISSNVFIISFEFCLLSNEWRRQMVHVLWVVYIIIVTH